MTEAMYFERKGRILVVDDEEIDRAIVVAILSSENYDVREAQNGEQALQMIQAGGIDMVLLDFVMPGIDGIEVCRRIKRNLSMLDLPVVFITSNSDRLERLKARDAGCDDFVTKPIDPYELALRVKNVLEVKAFHDQRARQKELLEAELERTREKLLQVDRLATLGTLVAGIGHEMGNVLSTLTMTTELMRTRVAMNLPIRDIDFSRLTYVANHLGTHTRYLLNYGRRETEVIERLDLISVIETTLDTLRVSGRLKGITIEKNLPTSACPVEANRTRIEQVIVNLVGNAVDALEFPSSSKPLIQLTQRETPAGRAEIAIADNGCGILAENLSGIFDAFYTTKPSGQGTGLGLAVVKKIVESYGGSVTVVSRVKQGTTITFDLPLAKAAVNESLSSQEENSNAACA